MTAADKILIPKKVTERFIRGFLRLEKKKKEEKKENRETHSCLPLHGFRIQNTCLEIAAFIQNARDRTESSC